MKFISSVVALSLTFVSSQAFSWGDIGHQTVGEVAQRYLTPEARQKIEQIMGAEILQASAIWPDIVRSDNRHKTFGNYHFLDVPAGMKYVDIPPEKKAKRNGDSIVRNFGSILSDKRRTRDEKMLAIRYLVHVIGDVHQPLHVGNSYDMGANACNVRLRLPHLKDEKLLNLHSLWDEEIIEFVKEDVRGKEIAEAKRLKLDAPPKRFFGASLFADMIISGNKDLLGTRAEIETADPSVWYQESADVRTKEVYPDAEAGLKAPVDEKTRAYCAKNKTNIPELGEEYLAAKVKVIEKQIYKAGLRLAYHLNTLAKNPNFTKYSNSPTKPASCPLVTTFKYKDCRKAAVRPPLPEKDQYTTEDLKTTIVLTPAEQAMGTVLGVSKCEEEFLKDMYLARLFDEHCLIK